MQAAELSDVFDSVLSPSLRLADNEDTGGGKLSFRRMASMLSSEDRCSPTCIPRLIGAPEALGAAWLSGAVFATPGVAEATDAAGHSFSPTDEVSDGIFDKGLRLKEVRVS